MDLEQLSPVIKSLTVFVYLQNFKSREIMRWHVYTHIGKGKNLWLVPAAANIPVLFLATFTILRLSEAIVGA